MTPKLPLQEFCQTMGFYALTALAGVHPIRRLGLYYARHAYLFEFAVPRALLNPGGTAGVSVVVPKTLENRLAPCPEPQAAKPP